MSEHYLLVNINFLSNMPKDNKIGIKFYNKARDKVLVIENKFRKELEYVYELWPCDLHYQEQIQIDIVQIDTSEGTIKQLGKSSPLVPYRREGAKYKFTDHRSMELRLVFRVGSRTNVNMSIQNFRLKNINEQMAQHIKACKSQISNYQEFINLTNDIIKDINKNQPDESVQRINKWVCSTPQGKVEESTKEPEDIMRRQFNESEINIKSIQYRSGNSSQIFFAAQKQKQYFRNVSVGQQTELPRNERQRKSHKKSVTLSKNSYLERVNIKKYIRIKPIQEENQSYSQDDVFQKTSIARQKVEAIPTHSSHTEDLAEYIKRRREQYRKGTQMDQLPNKDQTLLKERQQMSAQQQNKNKLKSEKVYEINETFKKDKIQTVNSPASDQHSQSNYLSQLSQINLRSESFDVLKRRKKASQKISNDQSIVGSNQHIQFVYKKSETPSTKSSRINTQFPFLLTINKIKIKVMTVASSQTPRRCVVTFGKTQYQTDLKDSNSNQVQWQNKIKIKKVCYQDSIKLELIAPNKGQTVEGQTLIRVKDLVKYRRPVFRTHLYANSLAVGSIQLRFQLCQDLSRQNNMSLPELTINKDQYSYTSNKDDPPIRTMLKEPPSPLQNIRQRVNTSLKFFQAPSTNQRKERCKTHTLELKRCVFPKLN